MLSFFTSKVSSKYDQTAYDFSFNNIQEKKYFLNQHKGKVLMIVNVASQCGFTKQYTDLQKLHEEYKDQGLILIGIPSNDFGNQEPGTNKEIKSFCESNFGITFPIMGKTSILGKNQHPFYKWIEDNYDGEIIVRYPQLAVAIGGAKQFVIEKTGIQKVFE